MARPQRQLPELVVDDCSIPLVTNTPQRLFATMRFFEGMFQRVAIARAKAGPGSLPGRHLLDLGKRRSLEIDSGGLLLLCYAGRVLNSMSVQGMVRGDGPEFENLAENLRHYFAPKDQRKNFNADGKYFWLRGIRSRDDMVSEVEEWASCVKKGTTASPSEVGLWSTQIGEVTTNSFQHGRLLPTDTSTGQIFIAGRAYKDQKLVRLAVLDVGSGIPQVIREGAPPPGADPGDGALIEHAFKKGVTSRCERTNQGAGLATLARTVRRNVSGKIQVLSSNGYFQICRTKKRVENLRTDPTRPLLRGTLIIVNLGY